MNFHVVRKLFGFYVVFDHGNQSPFSEYGKPLVFTANGKQYLARCDSHCSEGAVKPFFSLPAQ